MRRGDLLSAVAGELVYPFKSIVRLDSSPVVFTEGALEGEDIEARIVSVGKRSAEAEVTGVKVASRHREKPLCPHFGECGGCSLLYMSREHEMMKKEEFFRKIVSGKFPDVAFEPPEFGDRMGSRTRAIVHRDSKSVGFCRKRSNEIVGLDSCPLLSDSLNRRLSSLPPTKSPGTVTLLDADENGIVNVNGTEYFAGDDAFFQSNRQIAARLLGYVTGCVKSEKVLDLYAGIGFFSKALEKRGVKCAAFENSPAAAFYAEKNLRASRYFMAPVEEAGLFLRGETFPTAIVDPPRNGMTKRAVETVLSAKPETIVYVSCNIAVSVNDMKLLERAGYRLERAKLFDMYPATPHMEGVAVMSRISGALPR